MTRILTRVCTRCRQRRKLQEFWQQDDPRQHYGDTCHTCRPLKRRVTKRCRGCGHTKYVREFTSHNSTRDGLSTRCKTCIRAYNRRRKPKAGGICIDCGQHAHFRRCEVCRGVRQRIAEEAVTGGGRLPGCCGLSGCAVVVTFGTDFLGRTTMICAVHGERLMPTSGVRHYDQRDTLTLELAGFVERSKRAPKPVESASQNGMHFRRQSNAYRGAA